MTSPLKAKTLAYLKSTKRFYYRTSRIMESSISLLPLIRDFRKPDIPYLFREKKYSKIQSIINKSAIELAASLAIGITVLQFTSSPDQKRQICQMIAIQTGCTALVSAGREIASTWTKDKKIEWIQSGLSQLSASVFTWLSVFNIQLLIHEAGHALGAFLLFQNSQPKITITPFVSSITCFSSNNLTPFGSMLGMNQALFLVHLLGPACSLTVATLELWIGKTVKPNFPELSTYLITAGNAEFFNHGSYALSDLCPGYGRPCHDFHQLYKLGLHPLVAASILFAAPMIFR